ncbi:phytanoyl-CoA dioxygenase family protein [Aquihabitans sp. McL0605]|uniref:phytanoyl-CoA dioxygenase family protein n=1 Tax=Aquihabitans sp. McL0605 TaxID=3415671 RepID=UPI003CF1CCC6
MGAHRPTLRDKALDRRFQRDGYVIAPVATPDEIAAARQVFDSNPSGITEGYYASIHSTDAAYKAKVDAELSAILWPGLDRLLFDHRSLIAAFMVKEPTGASVVPIHQDWNTMEETDRTAGITCWLPLTSVTDAEGRFRAVPGSHRFLQRHRGSPGFPAPYEHIGEQISEQHMVTLDVRVGDVLVMDGRVLHTTPQNTSGTTRVAAYINALPAEVPSVHYYRAPDDGRVESFWVDDEFYTSFSIGERPPGEPFEVIPPYTEPQLTMDEFVSLMRSSRSRFARRPRTHA